MAGMIWALGSNWEYSPTEMARWLYPRLGDVSTLQQADLRPSAPHVQAIQSPRLMEPLVAQTVKALIFLAQFNSYMVN
jgi:hypothetical protein